jgi:hypothetical protein
LWALSFLRIKNGSIKRENKFA